MLRSACCVLAAAGILIGRMPPADAQIGPAGSPERGLESTFSRTAPEPGDPLPDITLLDSEGRPFHLRSLKENYTVLVFGCLT